MLDKPLAQLGRLNVAILVTFYVPIIILTPLYTYYMAVSRHEEKPFPAATITSTACYYPQDIVFRYTMLIASSILALIFFLVFRWMALVAKQI